MRRSGRPCRRSEAGLEQAMQMDDEIAGLGAVDRRLRLGAPGSLGAGVIGKDADNVELPGITKFVAFERFQLAAEHQVQPLRLCLVLGLGVEGAHDHISLRMRGTARLGEVAFALAAAKTQASATAAGQFDEEPVAARKPLTSRGAAASDAARSAPRRTCREL